MSVNQNPIYNNFRLFTSSSSRNIYNTENIFSQSLKDFHKGNYSPVPIEVPKAGIPLNILPKKKSEDSSLANLICPVCQNLIWNIVECSECGNFFCQYCAEQTIINIGSICPLCRANPFKIIRSKGLKKFFQGVKLKCINQKCKRLIEYSDYVNHMEKCEFRLYHCKNEGCTFQDTIDLIKVHSSECIFRTIQCQYCKKPIKKNELENHLQNDCSQNIECPKCHLTMTRGHYNSKHNSVNNDNIDCLKGQIEFYKNKYKNSLDKIEKLKKKSMTENDKLKNEIKIWKKKDEKNIKEINQLKQELLEWNNSFKDIYNKLIINKKAKEEDDEKQIYLKTSESEYKSNPFKEKFSNFSIIPKSNNKISRIKYINDFKK